MTAPKIPGLDMLRVEELLGMRTGYVMDLSNRELSELVRDELGVDIMGQEYASRGTSKANRVRALLETADAEAVGRLLRALWERRESRGWTPGDMVEARPGVVRSSFMEVVDRIERQAGASDIDALSRFADGATLDELIDAINRDAVAGRHAAALDRLHTYCMKFFAHLLETEGFPCAREESLHSRVGRYAKHLNARKALRPVTMQILKNSTGMLQAFNDVRNNASFAHDNDIVERDEARLIFDSVLATLRFVSRSSATRPESADAGPIAPSAAV